MSNYLRNNDDASREKVSPLRRRRLWLATGVVGLTGAVSLAGVAYATTGVTGPHRLADVKWSTAQLTSDDAEGSEARDDEHGRDGKDKGEEGRDRGEWDPNGGDHGKVREVPCDDEELVEAVDLANRDHGGTLKLAENCTYELNVKDRKNGAALPEIKQDITIKGNGSTIKRDSEDTFRIFRVADGGELTLKDLTVKGGNATEFKYGGGGPQVPTPPAVMAAPGSQGPGSWDQDKDKDKKKEGEGDGGAILVERGGSANRCAGSAPVRRRSCATSRRGSAGCHRVPWARRARTRRSGAPGSR
ncbi:hypothetical protein ACWDVU_35160 [Streptomyces sp. NPDC003333]